MILVGVLGNKTTLVAGDLALEGFAELVQGVSWVNEQRSPLRAPGDVDDL